MMSSALYSTCTLIAGCKFVGSIAGGIFQERQIRQSAGLCLFELTILETLRRRLKAGPLNFTSAEWRAAIDIVGSTCKAGAERQDAQRYVESRKKPLCAVCSGKTFCEDMNVRHVPRSA